VGRRISDGDGDTHGDGHPEIPAGCEAEKSEAIYRYKTKKSNLSVMLID